MTSGSSKRRKRRERRARVATGDDGKAMTGSSGENAAGRSEQVVQGTDALKRDRMRVLVQQKLGYKPGHPDLADGNMWFELDWQEHCDDTPNFSGL